MKRVEVWILLALTALTVAAYLPVLRCELIDFDDNVYVFNNAWVEEGLSSKGVAWAFTTFHAANWHPLTWLSLMADVHLYGTSAAGMHATNLLLHVANTLLLFGLFRSTTGSPWASGLTAALFALHPLHVESVAWVTERKDVLSTFFGLLSMVAYVRWTRRTKIPWLVLSLFLYACSLASKPMLVTLPFLLLLLDYWPLERWNAVGPHARSWGRLLLEKSPFFLLAVAACVVTVEAQRHGHAVRSIEKYPLAVRSTNAVAATGSYIGKTLWPMNLIVYYPHPREALPARTVVIAGVGLALATLAVLLSAERFPFAPVGWLWYLGTLVPVLGLVQVGDQAMADRYTYVPLIGLFLTAAFGLREWVDADRSRLVIAAGGVAVILTALSVLTWRQAKVWASSETLFRHALMVDENNDLAHNTLGNLYARKGELSSAVHHHREAIRLRPDVPEFRYNLGNSLLQLGDVHSALAEYERVLANRPDWPMVLNNIAWVRATHPNPALRNGAEAVRLAERACADPEDRTPAFLDTLAASYAETGRFDEALRTLDEAETLARQLGSLDDIRRLPTRRALYAAGRPFRDVVPSGPTPNR